MAGDLSALERDMTAWRRDLHAHPEFGFEEERRITAPGTERDPHKIWSNQHAGSPKALTRVIHCLPRLPAQ